MSENSTYATKIPRTMFLLAALLTITRELFSTDKLSVLLLPAVHSVKDCAGLTMIKLSSNPLGVCLCCDLAVQIILTCLAFCRWERPTTTHDGFSSQTCDAVGVAIAQYAGPYLAALVVLLILIVLEYIVDFFEWGRNILPHVFWGLYILWCAYKATSCGVRDYDRRRKLNMNRRRLLFIVLLYICSMWLDHETAHGAVSKQIDLQKSALTYINEKWSAGVHHAVLVVPAASFLFSNYNPLVWIWMVIKLPFMFFQWSWNTPAAGTISLVTAALIASVWAFPVPLLSRLTSNNKVWVGVNLAALIVTAYFLLSWWWTDSEMSTTRTLWVIFVLLTGSVFLGASAGAHEVLTTSRFCTHRQLEVGRFPTPCGEIWLDQLFSLLAKYRLMCFTTAFALGLRHVPMFLHRWSATLSFVPAFAFLIAIVVAFISINQQPSIAEVTTLRALQWCTLVHRVLLLLLYIVPLVLVSQASSDNSGTISASGQEHAASSLTLATSWLTTTLNVVALPSDLTLAATLPIILHNLMCVN